MCLLNRRLTISGYYQIVVLIQACICSACTACPLIVTCIIGCLAACKVINCAITSLVYCDCACVIAVAIYQTFDTACAVATTGNCCITVGAYYFIQAYLQGCLINHRSTIINNQLIVLLQFVVRCNYIGVPLISIISIIGYLAAAYAINRAIAINSAQSYIASSITIAIDITSQSVNAVSCTINQRCITISTLNIVQLNMHFCLLNGNAASSIIYQLVVAQLSCIAGKRCIINFQAVIICINICSIALALINRIFAAILHINNSTVSQLDIITINNSACQILNAYHTIDMVVNSIAATVGQISINIVQVNRARQNIRYALNCRCCAAYTIIFEFIIAYKAVVQLNACLPFISSLIIGTLFRIDSNNACILAVLDCFLRISDSHLTVQLCLHSVVEVIKTLNAQRIIMIFMQIAIRSVNSITGNIKHPFGNCDIAHGKVIAQVVRTYVAAAGNLSGPQPAAVIADVLQLFALQQAVIVLIRCKGIVVRIIRSQLAICNPAGDIKMICRIINPTILQVAIYRNLGQENLQQRVSAFIVKLPGCFLIIKIIAVQLLGILVVFQCSIIINDMTIAYNAIVYVVVAICCIAINIAYVACIAAYDVCHIASACYRSSAVSVAQCACSRIAAHNAADIASAADFPAISIGILINLFAISVSCVGCGLGYCYYAVEYLVQRAAVSTGDATDVAALSCIDYASVIACRQLAAVIAKQTADVFACKRCNSTVCCIIGACLNRTIVVNLVFIVIIVGIATTGDNTMVDTDNTADICYTADITIYSVHQGGVADSRANGIYADNTASAIFFRTAGRRSITMHLALIFHDDVVNFCIVFTDDAASTTSQSNNGTGVDNTYALFGSTGNGHFIFADNATDIVLADNKAFIAVAHAQELAYLAVFACVSADNAAYIGSLRRIHSSSVGRIGNDAHVFTGNAAKELRIRCNYRSAL